jgi:hypothetical protein
MPADLVGDRVEITTDQAKALQKAARGIDPVSLADTLSRADFYAAIRAGVMNVKADAWMYRDAAGELKHEYIHAGITVRDSIKAEDWLYPDHGDEQLKRELYQYSLTRNLYSVQAVFKAVFGGNYNTAMQGYGEQADMEDVVKVFSQLVAEFEAGDAQGRKVTGATDAEAKAYFLGTSQDSYFWSNSISIRQFRNAMSGFSNSNEYEAMFNQLRNEMGQSKVKAVRALADQYAAAALQQFRQYTPESIQATIATVLDKTRYEAMGDIDNAANVTESPAAQFLRASVALGDLSESEVTAETFLSSRTVKALVGGLYTFLEQMEEGGYRDHAPTWTDYKALLTGKLSPEELAERRASANLAATTAATTVRAEQSQKQASGFQVLKNELELVASRKWKNRTFKIDFPAGGAYVLTDTSDKPVLKRKAVRDLMKEKYGAKFWNFEADPVAGNEFTQPAWLIPSSHDLDALRADIENA